MAGQEHANRRRLRPDPGARRQCRGRLRAQRLWILRFNEGQIDDGRSAAPSQAGESQLNASADLGRFINGESVFNHDVVLWYAAHFTHDVHEEEVGHIVGPVLRPVQW